MAIFVRSIATVSFALIAGVAAGQPAASARYPITIDMDVETTVEIPPPMTHFMGREIAQTMHFTGAPWLVRESRQREEDCRLLIEALEIRPGQTVCDMGEIGRAHV